MEDTVAAEVEKKLKAMNIGTQHITQVQPAQAITYKICNEHHHTVYFFATLQKIEEIKFLKQNNPYSNTYNPGWKNHPNISRKDQRGNVTQQGQGQYQTQYQQQQKRQTPKKAKWEIAIEKLAAHNMQFQEETRNNHKNTTASIKNIEVQMGQIALHLASNSQAPGTLPSGTVTNPREYNNVNAVVTRSGKSTEENNMEEDGLLEVDLEIKEAKN